MLLATEMNPSLINPEKPDIKKKALRSLLWLGLVSITMLFGGLTSAYIVRQGEGKWAEFSLPNLFWISTAIIVLSSIPMQWALVSIRKGDRKKMMMGITLTFILGLAFVISQYYSWTELYRNGIVLTGYIGDIKTDYTYVPSGKETAAEAATAGNVAGSFLYIITGLHVVHLFAGLLALTMVLIKAAAKKYSVTNYNGVSMCALYWHFLSALWLYLFFFLLYIR
jgi:cytochrome c oxidase subunit III